MKQLSLKSTLAVGAASLLVGGLTPATAVAADPLPAVPAEAQQGVPYMSGGVSAPERTRMDELSQGFNLRVVTARQNGEYLADVNVTIRNERGASMLSTVTNGPWLLAQLPPGKYTVVASAGGQAQQETVTVSRERQSVVLLHLADV